MNQKKEQRVMGSTEILLLCLAIVLSAIFVLLFVLLLNTGNAAPDISESQKTTEEARTSEEAPRTDEPGTEKTDPEKSENASGSEPGEENTGHPEDPADVSEPADGLPYSISSYTSEYPVGAAQPVQGQVTMPSWIQQLLLTDDSPGRPKVALNTVKNVVVHYTAAPGAGAGDIRDNFQMDWDGRRVSAHFIIGPDGDIIECIPLDEVAHAQGTSNPNLKNHNYDAISIENCHPDETGEFTEKTYRALVHLSAWLLETYHLDTDALMRHYDATSNPAAGITGKSCPLYYVEHPEEWEAFKADVQHYMNLHPDISGEFK